MPRKKSNWWSRLKGWQRIGLALTIPILISLFVFFLYEILRDFFTSPWQGLLITGGLLVVIGALTSWKYVIKRTKKKMG